MATAGLDDLFVSFFIVAIGAYGGGLVTIPLIQHELVVIRGWLSVDDMARIIAIAQMTPGPIAINAATFVGFVMVGIRGAIVATAAVVLPSILLMSVVTFLASRLPAARRISSLRRGVCLGVVGLLLYAAHSYGTNVASTLFDGVLAVSSFLALVMTEGRIHPLVVVVAGGIVGVVVTCIG